MTEEQYKRNYKIVAKLEPGLNEKQIEARAKDEQYMEELLDRMAFVSWGTDGAITFESGDQE